MASERSSTMFSFIQEDWFDDPVDDSYHQNPQNIDDAMLMSNLSLQSFDEADAETEEANHRSGRGRVLLGGTMVNKSTDWGEDYTVDNDEDRLRRLRNDAVGMVVITRAKGGGRSLCLDMEEVKACRDLGFELEHQGMFQAGPGRVMVPGGSDSGSSSNTTFSGSPMADWRISGPGDDPRKVKARLKAWAQAVAIASASSSSSSSD